MSDTPSPSHGPATATHDRPRAFGDRRHPAVRIAGTYLALGLLWIWLSDRALVWTGIQPEHAFWAAAAKGSLFVVASAALIFWLTRREIQFVNEAGALLRAVADSSTDAVFVKDPSGRYLLFNEAAARFVGKRVEDVLGSDDTALFGEADARFLMARDQAVMKSGRAETNEEQVTAAGVTRTYLAMKAPYRDTEGNVIGVIGVSRDVTEWKRAEAAVRESETRFRELADSIPQIVWVAGADGALTHLNARAAEYSGVVTENLLGNRWASVIHPVDLPSVVEKWTVVVRSGVPEPIECRIRHADGTSRWHIIRQVPARDASGKVERWYGTCTDIEDLKRATDTLRDERTLLRTLIDALPDLIFTKDATGRFVLSNRAQLEFTGAATEAEVEGKTVFDLYPADQAAGYHADDLRVLNGGESIYDREELARDSTGRDTWRLVNKVPLRDHTGAIVGLVGISRNIQRRKEHEDQLAENRERLRLALQGAGGGVWDWDLKGDAWWSEEMYDLFGANPGAGTSERDTLALMHEGDRERVHRAVEDSIARREDYRCEFRIAGPRGERWMASHGKLICDPSGEPVRMLGLTLDVTARKRAEVEQQRLMQLIEASEDFIGLADLDGRVIFLNAAARRMIGLAPAGDLADLHFSDYLPPQWREFHAAAVRTTRDKGGWHGEMQLRHRNGALIDVYRTMFLIRNADGGEGCFATVTRDVTDRKRAHEALRESEERYRRLVDVLPDAVFINANDRVVFCNAACLELFGATDPADVVGQTLFELFHPDFHPTIRHRIATMLETGQPVPGLEERIVRLDGREVPVHVVATPITDRGQSAVLVCLSDLTERERSMGLLRSVLGSVTDAILTIDDAGTVFSANPATEQLFGYSAAELIGQNVRVLMPEPHRREHDGYVANYLRTGVAKVIGIGREVEGRRKDGTTFPLDLTVTEFRLAGERRFTGVLRDTTARKKLEDQFRQAQKMEAIGQLAGGVAHDFNNLLTVINGYSDLLMSTLDADDPRKAQLGLVQEAGERAAGLTAQLLAFSRKTVIEPKVLDLNELVEQLGRMLRRLIGEDVAYVTSFAPGVGRVLADPGQIEQVLLNLVVNSRDAMPRGGRLTVETSEATVGPSEVPTLPPGRYVRLAVGDTGCGMPPEVVARIFEPFFTTKGPNKGTGLGLATVYGIVARAGGHVGVESTVGRGTTFTVYLPSVPAPVGGERAIEPAQVAPRGTETVLLVEDEDGVRRLAQISLEMQGYTVLTASNAADALAAMSAHAGRIDLLLTDVIMPDMGGRDLAEAVRAQQGAIHVLFMSGYTGEAVGRYGIEEGTDAFLQKPFTPLVLARKVRQMLDKK